MPTRSALAVYGLGRIGRDLIRALAAAGAPPRVVAGPAPVAEMAYLLRYDSLRGPWPGAQLVPTGRGSDRGDGGGVGRGNDDGAHLFLPDGDVVALRQAGAGEPPPWGELGVVGVLDARPRPPGRAALDAHLVAGARFVLACGGSAEGALPDHDAVALGAGPLPEARGVICAGSVELQAAREVVACLAEQFAVERLFVGTIRAYAEDQALADGPGEDPRLARAAAANIVPAASRLAEPLAAAVPALAGRIVATDLRVPIGYAGLLDLTAFTAATLDVATVNAALAARAAAMPSRLAYGTDPVVSSDVKDSAHLATVDGLATMALGGQAVKVLAWYDVGSGYAHHVAALARRLEAA